MTPKQLYEARKAERDKLKDMDYQLRQRTEQIMSLDMLDRFVTAAERIADALERQQAATVSVVGHGGGGSPRPMTTWGGGSVG